MSADLDGDREFWIDEQLWSRICERAGFRCPICGDLPEPEDIEFFLRQGWCQSCHDEAWDRFMRD